VLAHAGGFSNGTLFTVDACARTTNVAAAYDTSSNDTLFEDHWHGY